MKKKLCKILFFVVYGFISNAISFSDDAFRGLYNYENLVDQITSAMSENQKKETIRKGADLQYMAETCYGDRRGWPLVWFFNRNEIVDPEVVKAGTNLLIPRLRAGISPVEATLALDNAYKAIYFLYAHDGKHTLAQRQWVLGQAEEAGVNLKSDEWSTLLTVLDKKWLSDQNEPPKSLSVATPRSVVIDVKLTKKVVAAASKTDTKELEGLVGEALKLKVLNDLVGDLEVEAAKSESSSRPEVHFALAFSYGRLGLKGKEYGALLKTEEAAKKPGVNFNIALVYGRKKLLESDSEAETFLVGSVMITSEPAGAAVLVDGKELGITPIRINKVKIGARNLELKLPLYHSSKESIEVVLNEVVELKSTLDLIKLPFEMVTVEGGTFKMGGSLFQAEKPIRTVSVSSFKIGKTEVTQALYKSVMGTNPSIFVGKNLPAEKVTWYDAVEFCNKLSELEGLVPAYVIDKTKIDANNKSSTDKRKWLVTLDPNGTGYRLPTEAQWEFAARGGKKSKGKKYSGSDKVDETAWYSENAGNITHEVQKKAPNELGLHDMSGNVWEWCFDWFGAYVNAPQQSKDPLGAISGSYRVLRGGCYYDGLVFTRVANRRDYPYEESNGIGFRIVLSIQ